MAADLDSEYAYRHSIVLELFIKTADDNYVTARWSYANGFDVDFAWNAVHCFEKYLKATLLLNGRSGKANLVGGKKLNYGHDIERLYDEAKQLAPELLPQKLTCPAEIDDPRWRDETPEQFITRLYNMGNADNRYQLNGYILRDGDLFKLDQMVFSVRRLCQPLESHFLGKQRPGVPDESRRQRILKDNPHWSNLGAHLELTVAGKRGEEARHAALNLNFPIAPTNYKHTEMRGPLYTFTNPVLVRRILDPLDAGKPAQDKHADDLWKWVREYIHLPPGFIEAYEHERAKRKAAAKP